jgi:nucleoside-diphosphate-sugar epimerase
MNPTANDRTAFERTNVLGTERLARAAAAAGVRRFIYLSSIKVNGERTRTQAFRADDIPAPQDDYARSKRAAERCLSAVAATSGMASSIIRPPLVYGPGVRANFLRLLSLAHSGLPIPLASITNARSMVSVWNLCDLICALLRHDPPIGGVFLVADGEGISTAELVRRLARIMGRPARLFAMPVGALRAAGGRLPGAVRSSTDCNSLIVDITQTRSRLGWTPPLTLDDGLARTCLVGTCSGVRSARLHDTRKIHLIAAARPNFMKIAPLFHALACWCRAQIVHRAALRLQYSESFFRDLRPPEPGFHLEVGSGSRGADRPRDDRIREDREQARPDWIIVAGDVN